MATEADICELSEKILKESLQPDFIKDLMDWGRKKYSRSSARSKLLVQVHSRKLYFEFLNHLYRSGWHKSEDGVYHIVRYLSHGEMAPPPVHIRMILDGDKNKVKKYIKNITYESS